MAILLISATISTDDTGKERLGILKKYELYRCKIKKIKSDYIVAESVFNGVVYYIKKDRHTKNFKVDQDYYFYATLNIVGTFVKKRVLQAVDYDEYMNKLKSGCI